MLQFELLATSQACIDLEQGPSPSKASPIDSGCGSRQPWGQDDQEVCGEKDGCETDGVIEIPVVLSHFYLYVCLFLPF